MPWSFIHHIREKITALSEKKPMTQRYAKQVAAEVHEELNNVESKVREMETHSRESLPQEKLHSLLYDHFGIQYLPEAQLTIRQGAFGLKKKVIDPAANPEEAYSLLHSEIIKKNKLRFSDVFQFPWVSAWRKNPRGQNVEALKAYYKMATGQDMQEIEFADGTKKSLDELGLQEAASIRSSIEKEINQGKKLNEVSVFGGTKKESKKRSPWLAIGLLAGLTASGVGYAAHQQAQTTHLPTPIVQRIQRQQEKETTKQESGPTTHAPRPTASNTQSSDILRQAAVNAVRNERSKLKDVDLRRHKNAGINDEAFVHVWLDRKMEVDAQFKKKFEEATGNGDQRALNQLVNGYAEKIAHGLFNNREKLMASGKLNWAGAQKDKADVSHNLNKLGHSLGLSWFQRRKIEQAYKLQMGWR